MKSSLSSAHQHHLNRSLVRFVEQANGIHHPPRLVGFVILSLVSLAEMSFFIGGKQDRLFASTPLETIQTFQEPASDGEDLNIDRQAMLIKIPLPVTINVAANVKSILQRAVESAPTVVRPQDRMLVVLEFDTQSGKTGRGSELEACQLLGRYLVSPEANRVETVAFIPRSAAGADQESTLSGHAVLIALSANQIVLQQGASLGNAGADETSIDNLTRDVYRGLASQRLNLPLPMVMAILDANRQLYRVRTEQETVFVDADGLNELEQSGRAVETTTLSAAGKPAILTGQQLREFRLIRHEVDSRRELAAVLKVPLGSLEQGPAIGGKWRAVEIQLSGLIDERAVQWVLRSLNGELNRANPANLVIINFSNSYGQLDPCLKLARYLVDLNGEQVQSVAYVQGQIRGSAALLAMACDQLILESGSKLGGALESADADLITQDVLDDVRPMVKSMARSRDKDWSPMMAMLNPELSVERCRNRLTGQQRLLSPTELEELPDSDNWVRAGPLDTLEGINAETAEQLMLARTIMSEKSQLQSFYQLEGELRSLEPTATDRYLERFAGFLTRPAVSMLLLFMAVFLLSGEMSSPGIGIAGFFSAVCFMLFFWSNYLEGNAGWFEILLFLTGVAFILIEIFAVPGLGIFGIGGIGMVLASMLLASQNFVNFRSFQDVDKVTNAMIPLLGAVFGFFAALVVLRNVLPNSPLFKRLILDSAADRAAQGIGLEQDPEVMVDWSYLQGKTGKSITRLAPSGKASIDGQVYDVITDGRLVDRGVKIEVIEAIANRVVVRSCEEQ